MKDISKKEAFEMRKVCGEKNVKKSHSRSPKYYLVESQQNLEALENYRQSKIMK